MSQYIELKLPLSVIKETDSIGKLNDVNIFTALDGEKNIHIGANHSTTGTDDSGNNISIGDSSLGSLTDGANNIALGKDSAEDLTTGDNNIVIGTNAQPSSVSINNEITFGDANITSLRIPGLSASASNNDVLTYDGSKIVLATPSVPTIGLDDLTDAFHSGGSIGIGTDALRDEATNGVRNTAMGYRALVNHTTGDDNVALGYDTGLMLDGDNSQNTFVGSMVCQLRTVGSGNSAIGYKSQGGSSATGDNNTSVGANALINLQGGHSNVAIGKDAGDSINSGFQNTMIGMDAGEAVTNGDNNTCIGYNAQASASTVNNEITLGDTNVTVLRTAGNIMPLTDNTQDLGSTSLQWQNIYTGDLHLSNERHKEGNSVDGTTGNWTIQEGAEDLFIINNKNGKKFKFCLKEIQ